MPPTISIVWVDERNPIAGSDSLSAKGRHDRALERGRRRLGAFTVGKYAENRRPRSGDARGQRAVIDQRAPQRCKLRAQRLGGRLEVVLERGGEPGEVAPR